MDAYVGDLSHGKELVLRHIGENYDAIISRGGTAQLIKEVTEIPVVEISLSVYDILRAIKLAENYQERYAIIGFFKYYQQRSSPLRPSTVSGRYLHRSLRSRSAPSFEQS